MKTMLVVAMLIAVVAVVCGEPCKTQADCVNHGATHCESQFHVVCHMEASGGQCECTDGAGDACQTAADCTCTHHAQHPHCVNNKCHCNHHN